MVPNQSIAKGSVVLYRVYTEKKRGFDQAADRLAEQLRTLPGVQGLTGLRIINRYDLEGIDEDLFKRCLPPCPVSSINEPTPQPSVSS